MRKRPLYNAEFPGRGNAKSREQESKGSEAREGRAVAGESGHIRGIFHRAY